MSTDGQLPPGATRPCAPPAPSIWMALALIAIYLLLQAMVSGMVIAVLALLQHHPPHQALASALTMVATHRITAVATAIFSVCVATGVVLWIIHRRWPCLWSSALPPGFGLLRPRQAVWPAVALALGVLAPIVGGLVTRLLAGNHDITQNVQVLAQSAPLGWRIALSVMAITLAPLVEELLFRGVLLSALIPRWGTRLAALGSAAAFAAIHLPGLQWQWYALPELLLLGLALAWLRLHYRSLWPSILTHGTNNALALVVLFATLPAA